MSRWPNEEVNRQLSGEIQDCFAAYRRSLPDPDPSASFMPSLWEKIEARRRPANYWFGRLARHFVTASVAFCLGMVAVLMSPPQQSATASPHTYVEVLDQAPAADGDGDLETDPGVTI